MGLSKKQRQHVFDKSGGKCWYCGNDLVKGWHVDHVKPIIRELEFVYTPEKVTRTIKSTGKSYRPENEVLSNCVPSCAPCNLFKNVFTIEQFRKEISEQVSRARRTSVNFRTAERYSQIETTEKPIVFYFEKENLKP